MGGRARGQSGKRAGRRARGPGGRRCSGRAAGVTERGGPQGDRREAGVGGSERSALRGALRGERRVAAVYCIAYGRRETGDFTEIWRIKTKGSIARRPFLRIPRRGLRQHYGATVECLGLGCDVGSSADGESKEKSNEIWSREFGSKYMSTKQIPT